jgi:tetratricopeptide (TPR) repeat protein
MEYLQFLHESRDILQSLEKSEASPLQRAEELLKRYPRHALSHFVLACCQREQRSYIDAIRNCSKALRMDPSFIAAAEMLLELNKDNYSVGELKYLYSLISAYKDTTPEMQQFLRKFKDIPMNAQLTLPEPEKVPEKAENLPGSSDNEYIRHLINEMDETEFRQEIEAVREKATTDSHEREEALSFPGESIKDGEERVSTPVPAAQPEEKTEPAIRLDFQPPVKQNPVRQLNNKTATANNYGIETMTMAQLYIRQGLYEHAMQILLKLKEKDPGSERIQKEMDRVKKLMDEAAKE